VHEGIEHTLISCSPELFLAGNLRTREIVTKPMKGTRPADVDPRELEGSIKDQAELAMIIDLMRNDLGRVCEVGSVRVEAARTIERHGDADSGVLQATGTIRGTLREGATLDALVRATFPGGSVTGAPKIRAQQIIDELEGVPRGYYCGSVGYVTDGGLVELNVAIRTAHVSSSASSQHSALSTQYFAFSVGAGIVADSDPKHEWMETLDKAWLLRHVMAEARRP
jgi:para-aminobenzoate synthetase component 1